MLASKIRLCLIGSLKGWNWLNCNAACSSEATQCILSNSSDSTDFCTKNLLDEDEKKQDHKRFAELFRRSKFVQLGDFEGRTVIGEVVRRVANDLYIDIGLKLHTVCRAPTLKNEKYIIGAKVLLRLHDPELSELFLGSTKELTLLEADATLLGLYHSHADELRKIDFLSSVKKEVDKMKSSISKTAAEMC